METEAKFELTDAETEQALAVVSQLGPFTLGAPVTLHLVDQYVDTPERDCLRAGYECRIRESERGFVVTLKSIDTSGQPETEPVVRREEIEQSLSAPILSPELWPQGPARAQIDRLRNEQLLVPLFTLRQRRLERPLLDADREVARLALDQVEVEGGDREQSRYSVLEVELAATGTDADLEAALAALASYPGLVPARRSKFERALDLLPQDGEHPQREDALRLSGEQPMPLAGALVLSRYWRDACGREEAVRAGEDPEAVHDMRVAVRRLRAALDLFALRYPKRDARELRRRLRRLGRKLGEVRDLEVLRGDVRAVAVRLEVAEPERLLADWDQAYERARADLLGHLAGSGYVRFRRSVDDFLGAQLRTSARDERERPGDAHDGPETVEPQRVCDVVPAEAWRLYGAMRAYGPTLVDASVGRLHRLRIAGKRLRYLLEAFEEILDKDAQALIDPLKKMQDDLGMVHDASVALALLADVEAQQPGTPDNLEPYLQYQRETLLESRARFEIAWPALITTRLRRKLGRAVAAL